MAVKENQTDEAKVKKMIDDLVKKAKIASQEYMKLDQKTVNNIIKAMSMAGLEHHMELAKLAVEETGRGIYEDKITKNMFATEYVYHSIKYEKTVGIINENDEEDYVEIAEPVGIIAGVTPVTNPTSTVMWIPSISTKMQQRSGKNCKRCCNSRRCTRKLHFMDRRTINFSNKRTYEPPRC